MSGEAPSNPLSEPGIELAPGVTVPPSGLRMQYARSSGPGGQNVNKVNTKAELWVLVSAIMGLRPGAIDRLRKLAGSKLTLAGEIHISADTGRSQEGNRLEAMERLRELIVQARHEPKPRRKTKPSRASKERRIQGKKKRSDVKSKRRGPTDW